MEQQQHPIYIVNGTDTPPEDGVVDNSLFSNTKNEMFRYNDGKWNKLEISNESTSDQ